MIITYDDTINMILCDVSGDIMFIHDTTIPPLFFALPKPTLNIPAPGTDDNSLAATGFWEAGGVK